MKEEDKTRFTIYAILVISVLIALPVWWRTTEIYRAELPYAAIEEWAQLERVSGSC